MLSEKLKSDILRARDLRQETLRQHFADGFSTTLFVSLNIPGADKNPQGAGTLIFWALYMLHRTYPDMVRLDKACDALGPYALLGINQGAVEVKQHCMDLETAHPVARLLDLDVFDTQGRQIDRSSLSLPPRSCLVCSQPALECIRLGRHSYPELVERAHELLSYFRN